MKKPKTIRTLQSNLYTLKSKEEEKQIRKALQIEKAILSFLPKKRRGFFKIGSKVVVLNSNKLEKEPIKTGFIDSFQLDKCGLTIAVRLPPFTSYHVLFYNANEVYHSIKDLAEHNKKYLYDRLEEYCRLLKDENYIIPMNVKPIYQRISKQITNILMKCKLPIPFSCI